jgi:thiazole synthase ThiGH ThiG subunit
MSLSRPYRHRNGLSLHVLPLRKVRDVVTKAYTSWLDKRTIPVGGGEFVSPFWHCYGTPDTPPVDEVTALRMLQASRSWLLPINCHAFRSEKKLLIGHGDVTWERFRRFPVAASCVPCLNINLQTSAEAAVELARVARDETGIDLVKLEVLNEDLRHSDVFGVIEATYALLQDGFRVMPLLEAVVWAADELAVADVPLLRIMGSPIGSAKGIAHPVNIREIVENGIPVILDGGIASPADAKEAMSLGCAGFLVNSCLFRDGDPVRALGEFRRELEQHPSDDAMWSQWWENRGRAVASA